MNRILFVSTSTTVGGAEKTLYTLATLIDPKICEVAGIISLKPKGLYADRLEAAGHKVYSFDIEKRAGLAELQKLARIVQDTKPTVVHAIMYQAIQLARAVRKFGYAEYKLISSPRVNYRTRSGMSLWIDKFLKGADDLLITECEASRKFLLESMKYDKTRVSTIHNGVDIAGWSTSKKERNAKRQELGVKDSEILIGSIGRLDEQKGHIYLLEAISKLRAVHPAKCVIVGDGPLLKPLKKRILEMALQDHVVLVGAQDDIPSWLSAFDIFALPSLWEGMPNAVLEAMAIGLPVVATEIDGVPEAITDDVDGILVEAKNQHRLFVALQDLVVDEKLRRRLGDAARETVRKRFKLVDMIDKYHTAYQDVGTPAQS